MIPRRQGSSRGGRRVPVQQRLQGWILAHLQAFFFSLGHFSRAPGNSLMTAAVIGISIALPAGLYTVIDNARQLSGAWGLSNQVSVYLHSGIPAEDVQHLAVELTDWPGILTIGLISPQQALAEYRKATGDTRVLDLLDGNPLPAVLQITPVSAVSDGVGMERLRQRLARLPEVEIVQSDVQWARRLSAILAIIQRSILIIASILALAVLLIVGNTIRLAISQRRDEIEIGKLFGATNAFIRRPFLYSGLFYGLAGSLIAWLLINLGLLLLRAPVSELVSLYQGHFELQGLGVGASLVLLLTGASLGLGGSWFAVHRYLRQLDRH